MQTKVIARRALDRAVEILGSQAALAKEIGYKDRRNVWPWFNAGLLPLQEKCPAIERATGGAVICEELRPDLPWIRVPDKNWTWHREGRPVVDVSQAA